MSTHDSTSLQFLAIGDMVIDAFIELEIDQAHIEEELYGKELCMPFGEKLPYTNVEELLAVGNAPNASVSAHRLGLTSAIMSHVGNDENGKKCLDALKEEGVNADFMIVEENKKTNYHYVLRYGAERTILIKHETFAYNLEKQLNNKPAPQWVYFSSVGENGLPYHHDIAQWVRDNNIKLVFQPGTFQIRTGNEALKDVYHNTELFFCNVEEARDILEPVLGVESVEEMEVKDLMKEIHARGPKIVSITDGPSGAYAYDGTDAWFMPIYPDPKPPLERTGAGDSFASTFTTAIILGKSVPEALAWGPINSMSVVQHIGAQAGLLSREKLEEYLKNAPESYKVEKI